MNEEVKVENINGRPFSATLRCKEKEIGICEDRIRLVEYKDKRIESFIEIDYSGDIPDLRKYGMPAFESPKEISSARKILNASSEQRKVKMEGLIDGCIPCEFPMKISEWLSQTGERELFIYRVPVTKEICCVYHTFEEAYDSKADHFDLKNSKYKIIAPEEMKKIFEKHNIKLEIPEDDLKNFVTAQNYKGLRKFANKLSYLSSDNKPRR